VTLTYCRLFGLDESQRQSRLLLAGLGPSDLELTRDLQRALLSHASPALAARFAQEIDSLPEYAPWLSSKAERVVFERRFSRFLLDLGPSVDDPRWFEERLRDTLGWARSGLSLASYICALGRLQRVVLGALEQLPDREDLKALQTVALKLFTLELSVAGESYRLVHTDDFRDAVDLLHAELTVDSLTKVSNRAHLLTSLKMKLRAAATTHLPLCLILADIDHFKQVNDQHGHPAGDAVLRLVTDRMRSTLREADLIGRLGGEEFAIVLEDTTLAGARILAERIREQIADQPCEHGGKAISVTLSQGIAEFSEEESIDSLIARADAALYAAKRGGRNRVSLQLDERRALSVGPAESLPPGKQTQRD
jgi:diguanylate cyclase (GGDEF)-like protein